MLSLVMWGHFCEGWEVTKDFQYVCVFLRDTRPNEKEYINQWMI